MSPISATAKQDSALLALIVLNDPLTREWVRVAQIRMAAVQGVAVKVMANKAAFANQAAI